MLIIHFRLKVNACAIRGFNLARSSSAISIRSTNFINNNSAIDIAHNPKLNYATKHIDIAYHFTRERIEDVSLLLLHIPSAENLADICTKALPNQRLKHLCTFIFGTK